MKKKGQGLPLQTIIIAAILLIVLAVTVYIFVGKLGVTSGEIDSCASKGGVCEESCDPDETAIGQYDCPDERVTNNNKEKKVLCCYKVKVK